MTWQYIAGFFDGEGSLVHNGKGYRILITQTNKEVLEKIRNLTHLGAVVVITKRQPHWKDSWLFYISKQEDVYKFIYAIKKFVVVKKNIIFITIPKLKKIIERQRAKKAKRKKLIKLAKKLRRGGDTYRQVGKKLNIDFGYARRIILNID
jgi:hypothetical protein